ncbi:MAG: 4-hydroxythreonine-4-phosphate dehydrogenase PdxA [Bacteroidia bacterium]|nr:4-hydroxythreonine-4-phosphate dehydrogenase PdxA [Bacteroidia bacterium]MDW8347186.1 4-hydroxythreonine-4-phosphate dehydrogenase PdxA [Bacteroidia bacterium]
MRSSPTRAQRGTRPKNIKTPCNSFYTTSTKKFYLCNMSKRIGITIGDINGISAEIIIKTFLDPSILEYCTPVIYGSVKVLNYYRQFLKIDKFLFQPIRHTQPNMPLKKIYVVDVADNLDRVEIAKVSANAGKLAAIALEMAVKDIQNGIIDAIVTAPIHKEAMKLSGFAFPGHTEFFAHTFSSPNTMLFMIHETIRVGLVTGHVPIQSVASLLSVDKIINKIRVMHDSLKVDFNITKPKIAVLGLNPHAGENGTIGSEENDFILPAIQAAKNENMLCMGPFPADSFFGSGAYRQFDGILAIYHDQGLIPFKVLAFGGGVNYSAGLPIVRTSPDHGTAYDIVGKNKANESSFRQAIFLALDILKNRIEYAQNTANPLKTHKINSEVE